MRFSPAALVAVLALTSFASAQRTSAQPAAEGPTFTPMEVDAAASDPKSFTLDKDSIQLTRLEDPAPKDIVPPVPQLPTPPGGEEPDPITTIDRIVNLAKKIFDIIKENQPVIDVTTTYANAVPEGITHWSQLSGWSEPAATRYRLSAKNLYGVEVIDCQFTVIRQHSGSYRGKGRFLNAVTVEPGHLSAAWGYRLGLKFEAPSVANVGTNEDPVASMIAQVTWSIATVLKHDQGTNVWHLRGDGAFREVGGAFTSQERVAARKTVERLTNQLRPAMPVPVRW